MSRKKAIKAKGSSKSPKASPSSGSGRTGKGLAVAAAASSGLVYPSRPSISNSGEFYDISFKVSSQLRLNIRLLNTSERLYEPPGVQLSNQLVNYHRCEVGIKFRHSRKPNVDNGTSA